MNAKKIAIAPVTVLRATAASILGIVSGTVVGCTNTSPNGNTGNNSGVKTATNVSTQSQDIKLRSVSVTVGDLSNPFFVVMGEGAEKEAKKIGGDDIRVTIVSSGYDLNQQFNQIENFIAADTGDRRTATGGNCTGVKG
ncbi:type 1 periplasmic-binding domain-containing protein [Atlanticothrix silvestris]|uniref:hypothetical protein n=1 Tax=Atlanticothrix silvestris TaxID=2840444 RepID=UPI00298EDC9E|nr:hypothetical protein [Atlanticothrix silvestris]